MIGHTPYPTTSDHELIWIKSPLLIYRALIGYRNREIKLFPKENAKADYISTLIPSIFNRITRSFRIRNGNNVLRMESGNRKGDSARGTVMKVNVKINFSGYLVVSSLDQARTLNGGSDRLNPQYHLN